MSRVRGWLNMILANTGLGRSQAEQGQWLRYSREEGSEELD